MSDESEKKHSRAPESVKILVTKCTNLVRFGFCEKICCELRVSNIVQPCTVCLFVCCTLILSCSCAIFNVESSVI